MLQSVSSFLSRERRHHPGDGFRYGSKAFRHSTRLKRSQLLGIVLRHILRGTWRNGSRRIDIILTKTRFGAPELSIIWTSREFVLDALKAKKSWFQFLSRSCILQVLRIANQSRSWSVSLPMDVSPHLRS